MVSVCHIEFKSFELWSGFQSLSQHTKFDPNLIITMKYSNIKTFKMAISCHLGFLIFKFFHICLSLFSILHVRTNFCENHTICCRVIDKNVFFFNMMSVCHLECKNLYFGQIIFSRPYWRSRLCYSVASVCRPSVTLCIVAKRCVLEQKLLLRESL